MKKVNSQSINAQSLMSKKALAISPKEYKLETYSVGMLHQISCVDVREAELEYFLNMRIEKACRHGKLYFCEGFFMVMIERMKSVLRGGFVARESLW